MNDYQTYNSSFGTLIEPEPIAYSFNTPGWYVVFGLVICFVLFILLVQIRKYRKNKYRRVALSQVQILRAGNDQTKSILHINILLKKIAIMVFGRNRVASLHGTEWFDFLLSTTRKAEFVRQEHFENYSKALYNDDYLLEETEFNEWVSFASIWIKYHKRSDD